MSYVAMGMHICQVCGKRHESGEILLNKRLKDIDPNKTVTGYGLCGEHLKLFNDGYIAMIEVDESKSTPTPNNKMRLEDASRTGRIMHIRREVAKRIFNTEFPVDLEMAFINIEAFTLITKDNFPSKEK